MTLQELKEIAIASAMKHPEGYVLEGEAFEPHPWVLDAVKEAYNKGLEDAAENAESELVEHGFGLYPTSRVVKKSILDLKIK